MRTLQVLCIIGVAGLVLARPQVNKSRMHFGYKQIKSGGGGGGNVKRILGPLGMLHNQYGMSKSVRKVLHQQRASICDLCPIPSDISPCLCKCKCNASMCLANINCGPPLTASELQKILSSTSYPVQKYSSLLVANTLLNGAITNNLLGTSVSFNDINISYNGFVYIDKHAFNYSGPILKKLHLNNNQLRQIDWSLEDMPLMRYMDISNNRLAFIPGDALHSEHLQLLNFSHNNIDNIGMSAFGGLTRLRWLDLSHNAVKDLGPSSLAFNYHEYAYIWINLSHNLINNVWETAISGVKSMSINLKYNQLESLIEEVFRKFIDSTDGTIHIDVTGNPIACDCKLLWIVQNSTVANCFDDFPVCKSKLSDITAENLGDC